MKSMLRYPGSKAKLLPIIMPKLDEMLKESRVFCDAFVGGGSVALDVAERYPDCKILLNDGDPWMYSFWYVVANHAELLDELFRLIDEPVTIERFNKLRETAPSGPVEEAYYALFFNRTTFSGIRSSGPIGGANQLSKYTVNCRYNSAKIKSSIQKANQLLKDRTMVFGLDVNHLLNNIKDEVIYLDPPYYEKGKDLYSLYMKEEEHKKMSQTLQGMKNWLISYDDHPFVRDLYSFANIETIDAEYSINGAKTSWVKKSELLIRP